MAGRDLPVDPARLRRQFPDLTDGDIAAFEEVTRRILDQPGADARAKLTRQIVAQGRKARERAAAGTALSADESLAARYLAAVEKMQPPTRDGGRRCSHPPAMVAANAATHPPYALLRPAPLRGLRPGGGASDGVGWGRSLSAGVE